LKPSAFTFIIDIIRSDQKITLLQELRSFALIPSANVKTLVYLINLFPFPI